MRPLPLLLAAWLAIVPVRVDPVTRVCTTAHDLRNDSSYARVPYNLIPTAFNLVIPNTPASNNTMSSPKGGPRSDASRRFHCDLFS